LGSRALGCHGSPPYVLGSHSLDYSLFDLLASVWVQLPVFTKSMWPRSFV